MSRTTIQIGSNAECSEPVCCLSKSTKANFRPAAAAGDYMCDTPPWTLDAIMKDIRYPFCYVLHQMNASVKNIDMWLPV